VISLSPGLAQGCFQLLSIAAKTPLTFLQLHEAFGQLGSVSGKIVIETTQSLGWLVAAETGIALPTPSGLRLQALEGYEPMLRQALLDYIEVVRPPWVQNATFGRKKVISFAGSQIGQVFVEAGLANGTDEAVVSFWDAMAALARGQKNERLMMIGRQGERLTLAHEQARTGHTPRWVAIDNNEDGYDILSVVESDDLRPLSVEVKSSTQGLAGSLFLSRNEWDRAIEASNHTFHLWNIRPTFPPSLAVLSVSEIEGHIPLDRSDGSWVSVEIPFKAFTSHFTAIQSS
jgi:hypothetical protein